VTTGGGCCFEVRTVAVEVTPHRRQLHRCGPHGVVQPVHTDPYDAVPRLQRFSGVTDRITELTRQIRYDDVRRLKRHAAVRSEAVVRDTPVSWSRVGL
jgi:hypothetical protein